MNSVRALLVACFVFAGASAAFAAETLHFVVMSPTGQSQEGPKYEALGAYLRSANPILGDIKLRIAKNYPEAASLFAQGDVEGMFSGSLVASILIAKGLARPVARPLSLNGSSTYRTSIVARQGSAPFSGIADLRGKRVAYCRLASAGDVFILSLLSPGEKPEDVFTPLPSDSHKAALDAVAGGAADYAVVKSTVFVPGEYPGLVEVGADAAAHPDNTLLMPSATYEKYGALITRVLLGLESDTSEKAEAAKQAFGCRGFIATAGSDFLPTFTLVRKARIDPKTFDFAF
ncbi:MAG TPA: PhnD/SsuA/transferrin family substrate-binding protein [Candidatus Methanoperedens sp.]|nr:PhnD/SsuA/transferrin family substrate-binding protein [Candidatus Methanoperedens sp.]